MGWRKVLRCNGCRLVRADPLPSIDEKEAIETQGYTDASAFPEVRDFFSNLANHSGLRDAVLSLHQLRTEEFVLARRGEFHAHEYREAEEERLAKAIKVIVEVISGK